MVRGKYFSLESNFNLREIDPSTLQESIHYKTKRYEKKCDVIRQKLNMIHSCIEGKPEDIHNSVINQICDVNTLQFLVHGTTSIKSFQFLLLL